MFFSVTRSTFQAINAQAKSTDLRLWKGKNGRKSRRTIGGSYSS